MHRLVLILAVLMAFVSNAGEIAEWPSSNGHFNVRYASKLDPIVINKMHRWVLHIEDAQGQPVTGAEISLTGGMPAHDHGLPTSPRMTSEMGNGDYAFDGMRFHMNGDWEITVEISSGGVRDTVIIALTI